MQAPAPKKTFKRELIPAKPYIARLYSIIEIGTEQFEYQGDTKSAYKVRLTWEIPSLMKVFNEEKGEQPQVISKEYTFSMHEKANLRNQVVHGMLGEILTDKEADTFDLEKLLGMPCILTISHKPSKKDPEVKYEEITGISTLMDGQTCPDQINPSVVLSYQKWDDEIFTKLPDFIKNKIEATPEYAVLAGIQKLTPDEDINPEDIPFN